MVFISPCVVAAVKRNSPRRMIEIVMITFRAR
jgi:hypothetical protein